MMRPPKEYGGSKRAGFPDLLFSTVFRTLLLQLFLDAVAATVDTIALDFVLESR